MCLPQIVFLYLRGISSQQILNEFTSNLSFAGSPRARFLSHSILSGDKLGENYVSTICKKVEYDRTGESSPEYDYC